MDRVDRDKADFAARLLRHHSQVFGYIYSLVRNIDDADDLFQQTSLVLWDKFDQYDRSRSFVAWACGVARFEVSNFVRHRGRSRLHFSDELCQLLIDAHEALDRDLDDVERRRDALASCLKKLRSGDQELVDACYERSARIAEVADRWGRSTQSIHNSLRRIRRALFECVSRSMARGELA